MDAIAEGPLYKTQRVEGPDGGFYGGWYVEISQVRSSYIVWNIEHGSLNFGHSGTWGRDNVRDAFRCFAGAVVFETRTVEVCGCWNFQKLGHCTHTA